MSNHKYIGEGEIKYLDKLETKLGAFLYIDIESIENIIKLIKNDDPNISEVLIYALPNKKGSHSVKIKYGVNNI